MTGTGMAGTAMRAALLGFIGLLAASPALGAAFTRESDVTSIRLGEHILVDDATCPSGQIKELVGKTLTARGVISIKHCIPRRGAKSN